MNTPTKFQCKWKTSQFKTELLENDEFTIIISRDFPGRVFLKHKSIPKSIPKLNKLLKQL